MSHRISRALLWLVPILVVTLFPIRASGQESAAKEAREEKAEHSPQSVTGCCRKAMNRVDSFSPATMARLGS